MNDHSDAPQRNFACFISYSHSDNKTNGRQWATWLQQALETYEVPPELVGKPNRWNETVPARIFPVFRDEEELSAHSNLKESIQRALDGSTFMVVICSPRAVASKYVPQEIEGFISLGKAPRILAAIIDGEPNASGKTDSEECFPAPLRSMVNPEGEAIETIAADFRIEETSAQGWTNPEAYREEMQRSGLSARVIEQRIDSYTRRLELMKLKILAGLLGVDLGELTRRDKAYQLSLAKKRAAVLRRWLTAVGALAIAAGVLGWLAQVRGNEAVAQKKQAVEEKDRAEQAKLSESRSLALSYHDQAVRLITDNRTQEASAYIAKALRLDPDNRLYSSMAYSLLLDESTRTPARPPVDFGSWVAAKFSPDGKTALVQPLSGPLRKLDLITGDLADIGKESAESLVFGISFTDRNVPVICEPMSISLVDGRDEKQPVTRFQALGGLIGEAVITNNGNFGVVMPHKESFPITGGVVPEGGLFRVPRDGEPDTHPIHEDRVISIHPWKEEQIVSVGLDNKLVVWNVATKQIVRTINLPDTPEAVAFDSASGLAVIGTDNGRLVYCWCDSGATKEVVLSNNDSVEAVAISKDGRFAATSHWDSNKQQSWLRTWDTTTLQATGSWISFPEGIASLAFSHDGRKVAAVGEQRRALLFTSQGQLLRQWITAGEGSGIVFTPDDSTVVTAVNRSKIEFQPAEIASPLVLEIGPGFEIGTIQTDSSGKWLLATSGDDADFPAARIYDATTGRSASILLTPSSPDEPAPITAFAASSGSDQAPPVLFGSSAGSVELVFPDGTAEMKLEPLISANDPEGIFSGGEGKTHIRVSIPGIEPVVFQRDRILRPCSQINTAAIDEYAEKQMAAGVNEFVVLTKVLKSMQEGNGEFMEGRLEIHDAGNFTKLHDLEAKQVPALPRFSSATRTAAAMAGSSAEPMLWRDVTTSLRQTPLPLLKTSGSGGRAMGVHLAPDGTKVLANSTPPAVLDLNAPDPQWKSMNLSRHVTDLVLSPDNRLVAFDLSSNDYEGLVQLWDLASGNPVTPVMRHADQVNTMTFSEDGRWLLTTSDDFHARLWDTRSGRLAAIPFKMDDDVISACFVGSDRIACSTGRKIHIFPMPMSDSTPWAAASLEASSGFQITDDGNLAPVSAALSSVLPPDGESSSWKVLADKLRRNPETPVPGLGVDVGNVLAANAETAWISGDRDRSRILMESARKVGYAGDFSAPLSRLEKILGLPAEGATAETLDGRKAGDAASGPHGMRFRWCPPGRFLMGSPATENPRSASEQQREVVITRGFWISETEITQSQWEAVMEASAVEHVVTRLTEPKTFPYGNQGNQVTRGQWLGTTDPDAIRGLAIYGADLPMICTTWKDAMEFTSRLGISSGQLEESSPLTGSTCRLPTEAEWEYACRAGTRTPIWTGESGISGRYTAPPLGKIAWYGGNSGEGFSGKGWNSSAWTEMEFPASQVGPRQVATKAPNPWGIHDMLGNVSEWTKDARIDSTAHLTIDPAPDGGTNSNRVYRGGAFVNPAASVRAAGKFLDPPDWTNLHIGFRVVIVPDTP